MFYTVCNTAGTIVTLAGSTLELEQFMEGQFGDEYIVAAHQTQHRAIQSVSYQNALDMDWVTPAARTAYDALINLAGAEEYSAHAIGEMIAELTTVHPWLAGSHNHA